MKSIGKNQLVLLLVGLLFVVGYGDDPGKPAAEIAFASDGPQPALELGTLWEA